MEITNLNSLHTHVYIPQQNDNQIKSAGYTNFEEPISLPPVRVTYIIALLQPQTRSSRSNRDM